MLDIELTTVPKAKSKNGRKTFKPSKLEEKVVVGETDMPQELQSHALRAATEALDIHEGTDYKDVAYYIKNQFDKAYGSGWQCITGVSFGSYVTHSSGSFIHFCLGRLAIMLFKSAT
ncbi:uncharacterized protein [Physcomitrium patens]|jgi:dynein light chain LC8-type|uniref:Dynein light chain n=1 Tax=Physcomitrium patens TaxID=3218 RepID=A9SAT2_PHYPA|nr:dynein light chain LC6, flagellar outer arm-like isoform X1 [Physcomitrium patens]PNR45049.1 hypothetical protein PHYPA_014820 [Physcomitrium patens]|eukprot:XP_024389646.1 dynein light chain LC6, flagellar outer arm-like isoform X1 [Physcomitrella patens]